MDEQEMPTMKELQNDPWVGSFYPFPNGIWWGVGVGMARYYWMICDHKIWIIVVYPKVWSVEITNHVVEWGMDIIGNFLMEVMVDSWENNLS
jgi:hypothetical protein